MQVKRWYQSRLVLLGALAIAGAVSEGILNSWGWRQTALAALGALIVTLRIDTKGPVSK